MKPTDFNEQETVYIVRPADSMVSVYSCVPADLRHLDKLVSEHANEARVISADDYGRKYLIPKAYMQKPRPPYKKNLTPEQRQALSERAKLIRQRQQDTTKQDDNA